MLYQLMIIQTNVLTKLKLIRLIIIILRMKYNLWKDKITLHIFVKCDLP
jgi:hypothetical protein